ncbi:hypothetical protein ACQPW3_33545 [Actinosynnema sp. CA-248983]
MRPAPRSLNLADCGLSDDDVEALTASATPLLRGVSLAYNNIGSHDEEPDPEREAKRADRDFRTGWAESHAELVEVALDFARRMKAGDIGWPP